MEIELHHLRQFAAVADELHFGRAAARLCMAQPPLSQSIRRLEAGLGVRLLERTHRRVELTPAGHVFFEEARRTLVQADAAVTLARRAAATQQSELRITFTTAALFRVLPRALRTFRNIAQVQSEKGLFSKDEVTRYAVTIEVANPYAVAIPLRVVDQVPLQGDKNVEVSLIEAKGAEKDDVTGKLTWKVSAPPSGKVKLAFVYELKRPKGYRVHQ